MIKILAMLLLLLPGWVLAEVNPKTGYFKQSFDDISLKVAGEKLKLTRTYHSASLHSGWFGPGWSSPLEKRLIVAPNNTVYIRENGAVTVFQPKSGMDEQGAGVADIDAIMQTVTARENLNETEVRTLREELLARPERRADYVEQYGLFGNLQSNTLLQTACGTAEVVRLVNRYKRTRCVGHAESQPVEYFDLQGRLVSLVYLGGYRISLEYRESPHGVLVRDNRGQWMFLTFADSGRVDTVRTHQGNTLSYRYDKNGQLSEVEGAAASPQRFIYDKDHLLTRFDYAEEERYVIAYFPQTRQVREVTDPLQATVNYEYGMDAAAPLLQWTRKTTIFPGGREETLRYQFRYQPSTPPRRKLAHMLVHTPTDKLEVNYDATGRIIHEANSSGEFNTFSYHPVLNKITEVRNQEGSTVYSYDKKGNLQTAIGHQGARIDIAYDVDGTIRKIVETDARQKSRREIRVRYNALQKPTTITLVGVGTIHVLYDAQGGIDKVSSKGGAILAIKITQTFQSLMAVLNVGQSRLSTKYLCCSG